MPEYPLFSAAAYASLRNRFETLARVWPLVDRLPLGDSAQARLEEARKKFAKVKTRLERTHFYVGMIGSTQAGKSTAVNNAFGMTALATGEGKTVTARPTRVKAATRGQTKQSHVRYLTPTEFNDRCQQIYDSLGLQPSWSGLEPAARQAALRAVEQWESAIKREDAEVVRQATQVARDRAATLDMAQVAARALRHLLHSYQQYGTDYVKKPAREDELPADQLERFTRHPDNPEQYASSPINLAREVVLDLPVDDKLKETVALVDLPGFGSVNALIDDVTTDQYINDLAGALLFVTPQAIRNQDISRLLARLRQEFGELAGRVWVVVNRFDGLAENYLLLAERSLFKVLRDELIEGLFLKPEQIAFVSKNVFNTDGATPNHKLISPAWPTAADGNPAPLSSRQNHPEFEPAMQALLHDGGISRLRHILSNELATTVAQSEAHGLEHELILITKELRALVSNARERETGGYERAGHALVWRTAVRNARDQFLHSPVLNTQAQALRDEVIQLFEQRVARHAQPEEVRLLHPMLVGQLQYHAQALADASMPSVYAQVDNVLQRPLNGTPPVPVEDGADAKQAWENKKSVDTNRQPWRETLKDFQTPLTFCDQGMTADDYRDLMEAKIQQVILRAFDGVVNRIVGHLDLIASALFEFADGLQRTQARQHVPASAQPYDEVLQLLPQD